MCLWTSPILIASHHPHNAASFGEKSRDFKLGDPNLFDDCLLTDVVVVVDHDIAWHDI